MEGLTRLPGWSGSNTQSRSGLYLGRERALVGWASLVVICSHPDAGNSRCLSRICLELDTPTLGGLDEGDIQDPLCY